ncbi:MAG: fimbria major subunit [Muribaculaceae bacterium]|nr:fimbria major subunit [Muribaculaceae bacterium]
MQPTNKYLTVFGTTLRRVPAYVCAMALMSVAASCSSDHKPEEPPGQQTSLTVKLSVASSSRAIGDYTPELPGVNHENDIDNIFLWVYRDSPAGPNGDADIIYSTLVNSDQIVSTSSGERHFTIALTGYKPAQGDRLLAVANMGDMSRHTSLKAIREAIAPTSWSGTGGDATGFTMASARFDDGIVTAPGGNDPDAPFTASMSIERLAARIDLRFPASDIEAGSGLCYTAVMPGAKKDLVHLTHVVPTNLMQTPSYVLKHVTADAADGCFDKTTVCGHELVSDISGVPVNYVVEPNTATKSDASDLSALYGDTRAGGIDASVFDRFSGLADLMSDDRLMLKDGNDRALILSYANENTHHMDMADSRFVTGLMLRAEYEPAALYAPDGTETAYVRGSDFYRLRPLDDVTRPLCFATRADAESYRLTHGLGSCVIDHYAGGVCYYPVWIRHRIISQSGDQTRFPMEFGIVRNHVYRVEFTFSGPGYPEPDLIEPENIQAVIYVRPWSFRRLDETIM